MRKATNKSNCKTSRKRTPNKRLALLAALFVTSTVAVDHGDRATAANPGIVSRTTVPPLPVSSPPNSGVKNNPFVQSNRDDQDRKIRLASGDTKPAIRLRPLGAPIGLNTIGEDPIRVRPATIAIDQTMAPTIQQNPLVGSSHHEDADLVNGSVVTLRGARPDAAVADGSLPSSTLIPEFRPPAFDCQCRGTGPAEGCSEPGKATGSVVKLAEVPCAPIAEEAGVAATVDSKPVADQGRSCRVEVADVSSSTASVPTTDEQPPIQLAVDARDNREPIAESQPIFFSISDSDETEASDGKLAPATEPVPVPVPTAMDNVAPGESAPQATSPDTETKNTSEAIANEATEPSGQGDSESGQEIADAGIPKPVMADEPIAPIQLDEEAIERPVVIDVARQLQPAPKAVYREEPVVAEPVQAPEPTLAKRRFRPPVAVDSPPIAVIRSGSSAANDSIVAAVQSAQAPVLETNEVKVVKELPKAPAKKTSEPAVLRMSRAQVRSLTIGGYVRRVAVGDKNICQAFTAGPNHLKLIGTGNGVTRLVVWADTSDSSPTSVRRFDVYVEDKAAASETTTDKATVLNESIRRAFPTSHVFVQQLKGSLVVNGYCEDEETAKKIVRMIRKTCLIPVRDEIQVR